MKTTFDPVPGRRRGLFLAWLAAAGVAWLASTAPSGAAATPPVSANIYNYLELLRSDFNSAKVDLVNQVMKLSAGDAKRFWPIYRAYENEMGRLSVDRAEFIAEFVNRHQEGTFDDANAKAMAQRWFKGQQARLDLLKKYHRRIERSLSPLQAAQFLQLEHQLGLFVDLTIASEMPFVGEQPH